MTGRSYEVVVIGAGVVGAALARDLAGLDQTVALVDARNDVSEGTSKANTAILHTGYDASPGTLESQLVAQGYHLLRDYCQQAGICVEQLGAVLVAWDTEQLAALPDLAAKAEKNGYHDCQVLSREQVLEALPHASDRALGGLLVPGESIIDPWSVPLALATDAVNRGAELLRGTRVTGAETGPDSTRLTTTTGDIQATWVVNAAGLGADTIDGYFGYSRLVCHPRRGELLVFDKLASRLVDKIVLPVPSRLGKGVLVSPTVFGNVMLGPTAEDMTDRDDTSTTADGFAFLLEKGAGIIPELLGEEVSASYAGLRAAHNLSDYLLEVDAEQRYVIAGAIRSTGLTSAMAVSQHLLGKMRDSGLSAAERAELPAPVQMPPLGERSGRPCADADRVAQDPAYGEVVCFCERVSRGEIRDAFASVVPPAGLSGLRRRTRAMNGRCQGFFCGAEVDQLLRQHQEG
ncbi:MAG: FAD-dependent oxidoreductase [Actinomycetia bacterium]|nr:FAD-dependent oxidoreductase [Actinomycetes bacterium]